jgi:hypothetical protein
MTSPLDRELERIAADYDRYRAGAIEAQRRLREVSASATSPQGLVTIQVDAQGEVRAIVFNSKDYRTMAPAELAHVLVDTIGRARKSVVQQLVEVLPMTSFGGVSVPDMLGGQVDWDRVLPERLGTEGLSDRRTEPGRG